MKRTRIIGLALVAAFALSAVAATAAFGFSEFNSKGNAKAPNPEGIKTEGKGGKAFFESTGGEKVECEKSTSKGEYKSKTEARVIEIKYEGKCELIGSLAKGKCTEPIKVKELTVTPGTQSSKTVLWFKPTAGTTAPLAEFECGGAKIKVLGSVICQDLKPALGTKTEIGCKQVSAGKQEFTEGEFLGTIQKEKFLEAEATSGFFKLKEHDAQNTTEVVTLTGGEVEQTP